MSAAHLVLFDGSCGLCNASVRWLIAHDHDRRISFAPLTGATSAALRQRHPELAIVDSLVYVQSDDRGERVHLHALAVLAVLELLPQPWRTVALLRHLPRWILDGAYRLLGRYRYRVWGRIDHCEVPSEEPGQRFLP